MMCAVYKTKKKTGMYLYVSKQDDFSRVPEVLMKQFGHPELVMVLPLDKREQLGSVDKDKLVSALANEGFYLQMPPVETDMLAEHRESLGLSPQPEKRL